MPSSTAVSGKSGRVIIGTTASEVLEWNLNRTVDALDVTSMSSAGHKQYIAGLDGADGSMTTNQFLNKTGAQGTVTLGVGSTAASNAPDITGAIIITTEGIAVPVDDKVGYSYDFVFNSTATVAVS